MNVHLNVTTVCRSSCHHLLAATLLAAMSFSAGPSFADQSLALLASETRLARLAPDVPSGQLEFTVDGKATMVMIDIGAIPAQLAISVTAPTGQVVTESNIGAIGGAFTRREAVTAAPGPGIYAISATATHYLFQFPSLGSGRYAVNFSAAGLDREAAVIAQLSSDSSIGAGLLFTDDYGVVGRRTVISAALVDGTTALPGAAVTAHVLDSGGVMVDIVLLDNGVEADARAGDGLYSGFFTPVAIGRHHATADLVGVTPAAEAFRRQASAQLDVVAATAQFNGDIADHGLDTNGNGHFEQIVLSASASVAEAGNYRATAYLHTPGKQAFEASSDQPLAAGDAQVSVGIPVSSVAQIKENGPYTVDRIVLQKIDGAVATHADTLAGPRSTQTYTLAQFERAAIALTGTVSDFGVDMNGNGLFDLLTIVLEIDLEFAGAYRYSGRLTDRNGLPVESVSGAVDSSGGRAALEFEFNGRKIGAHGVSGPYILDNVLIYGAGQSFSRLRPVATTHAYDVRLFEAGARNPADVNGDGQVDCADVALVKASFGKRSGQAGADPRTDVNADLVTDVRDLAIVSRALPIGTRCP